MDFGTAFSKPFSNIKNLVIGIVLMIIPLLNIITAIFIIPGYMLRVANTTMKNDKSLPGFENFGELIINSIKLIVVSIVYGIIGVAIAFILMLIPIIGPWLALVWFIIFMFIAMSAMMMLAKAGSFGDAFKFGEIIGNAKKGSFIVAVIVGAIVTGIIAFIVLIAVILIFAAAILSAVLGALTNPAALAGIMMSMVGAFFIGGIILTIVVYILEIFFFSLVASAYGK